MGNDGDACMGWERGWETTRKVRWTYWDMDLRDFGGAIVRASAFHI
jgi:hypothetical protein